MKLRSLQIKGFKSFAHDTTIHFNDEIIGIVGPNGSGKSNIVDSIRWVLGEQKSKELRLEKMVDVIFNGTKSKKKAGMAQVSMTFDNTNKLIPLEFDQVKVSRILYNTNESEYRINDVTCRLKDIRNLFLDTGIGSNSYSIIELGMVDDILSDKDNARRRMFEQAAGISKYKSRKRETLLKLNSTQADLDRVDDIIFELQDNLKKFERQAKRTKKYYELKDQYKELSIQKAVLSQKESITKEQELKAVLSKLKEEYTIQLNETNTLEAEIEKTKKANLDSEELLSHKQKEFSALIDQIRKSESNQDMLIQKQNFVSKNIERVTKNKVEFSDRLNELRIQQSEKEKQLEELTSKSENLEATYLSWKAKYEEIESKRQAIQGENTTELDELKMLEEQRFTLEKSIIELNSQIESLAHHKNVASQEVSSVNNELGTINSKLEEEETRLSSINKELSSLQSEKENFQKKQQELNQNIETEKASIVSLNRKRDAQSNELDLLLDMMNNLEGFPESSKFLYKNWKEKKPVLADIIETTDTYRNALESYLEPYLNYFVLDSVEDARESIKLLRSAQKGKSKFFILSSFQNSKTNEVLLYDHLGKPALSVIKYDLKYDGLMTHLLSNVVIVGDDKVLQGTFPSEDVIYISPSGDSKRTRHTVSGGSLGLFDGKRLGRKQAAKDLKSSIEKTDAEIEQRTQKIQEAESQLLELNLESIDQNISKLILEKNTTDIKLAELKTKVSSITEIRNISTSKINEYEATVESNSNKVLSFRSNLQTLIASITTKQEIVSGQTGAIEEIAKDFGEVSSLFNNAQLAWVQHQNDTTAVEKEVTFYSSQVRELTQKATSSDSEIQTLKTELENSQEQLGSIKSELSDTYGIRDNKQKELGDTEAAFFSKRSVINDKELRLKKLNKKLQDFQLDINNRKDELTGIEFELRSSMDRLKIEFNIDIKTISAEEVLAQIEDTEAMTALYEKIRKRLDNYGEINPMAVEAYDEILARYESMDEQKNDILEAKESLLDTIKEIDTDAAQKFMDAFDKVRTNFKEVFRSLFSDEDDCDLVLFNMEDPLSSGIEIIAKPKGKRPKVLNQLSGGEKTLTATALLFSLYLLKPAPFCIFDEVDAPLDDLNIQKFSRLIKRFSDHSQFIIITHNKSTMANMDLLYGVYMQEQGISGITQVDFREYEHSEVFQSVNLN